MSQLFKRAYARGVNDELIRLGYARYPSKLAADEVADAVGDQLPVEPAAEAVPPDVAAEVAATLVDAANQLVEASGAAPAEGEEMDPAAAAQLEEIAKESAADDIDTRAYKQAEAVMVKAANEGMGSTIAGGDKDNSLTASPQAETAMESAQRPQGMHNLGVGNTKAPVGQGNVGTEQVPAPEAPSESPSGSNSVIEQSKMGMHLRSIIQKIAMGSTIEGGDKGNSPQEAAGVTGEAALDQMARPEGYAVSGVGNTAMTPGSGVVGSEQPHPEQPGQSPMGANSLTEWSDSNGKTAMFMELFKETAEKTASHLPNNFSEEQKIAHIRQMMGMTDLERSQYIGMLHKEAGASDDVAVYVAQKHAEETRQKRARYQGPGSTRQDRTQSNQKRAAEDCPSEEKKPEEMSSGEFPFAKKDEAKKEEDKKEEEKKEAASKSLLDRIRLVSQQTLRG